MHFERQGFRHYLPMVQGIRRHARRTDMVLRPFFPGYLFLHLAPAERHWSTINSTIGAAGAVRLGDYFPPVPDWVIADIRARENNDGFIPLSALGNTALKPGDRVEVIIGDQDAEGVFLRFRGQDRVVLLLQLLHRQLQVEVPLARLKVA